MDHALLVEGCAFIVIAIILFALVSARFGPVGKPSGKGYKA